MGILNDDVASTVIRPHRMHEMRTMAIDDPWLLSVCHSVCLSLSRRFGVQTEPNDSKSCLSEIDTWGPKEHRMEARYFYKFDAGMPSYSGYFLNLADLKIVVSLTAT